MSINWGSTWRGIKAMTRNRKEVTITIKFKIFKMRWCDMWTPVWHEGRGPYITMGFYFVAFYRGY